MRILPLGGVLAPILFSAVTVIVAWLQPDYSHLHQFISELGATGAPYAPLMNFGGFIPSALLFGACTIPIRNVSRGKAAATGSALLMLFSVGVLIAGVANCDVGCPQGTGTIENRIHDGVSPLAFIAAIAGIGLLGTSFRRVDQWRRLGTYSLVSAAAALGFMLRLVWSLESRHLTGLWQRLLLATVFTWFVVVSLRLRRAESTARP